MWYFLNATTYPEKNPFEWELNPRPFSHYLSELSEQLIAGADWPYNEVGKIPRGPFSLGALKAIGGPPAS
jgi:hypothetical protein